MDAENNEMTRDKLAALLLEQMQKWITDGTVDCEAIDQLDGSEFFGAFLFAMFLLYQQSTGDDTSDLLDFTHILNRLATGIVIEGIADTLRTDGE